jgi:hypothetical protein
VSRPIRTRARAFAVALALGVVALLPTAGTAQAATSWTHNNHYNYAGLYAGNAGTGGVIANEYNDQPVTMLCWADSEVVRDRNYSNYDSPRWFQIRDGAGRVGWIHSSYVYYQTSVGRC